MRCFSRSRVPRFSEYVTVLCCCIACLLGAFRASTALADAAPTRLPVAQAGRIGYIDHDGKLVIAPRFEWGRAFSDGLAAVRIDKRWGYIREDGSFAIEPMFDEANDFNSGRARVKIDGSTKLIDTHGEVTSWSRPSPSAPPVPQLEAEEDYDSGEFYFVDRTGDRKIAASFEDAHNFSEGLGAAKQGGLWGFVDESGTFIIAPQFANVLNFTDGLAAVKRQGAELWSFIDKSGREVIPPRYPDVTEFAHGFAVVHGGARVGVIDTTGREVAPTWYDNAGVASADRIWLQSGSQWSWIAPDGTVIWRRLSVATLARCALYLGIAFLPVAFGMLMVTLRVPALRGLEPAERSEKVYSLTRKIRLIRLLSILLLIVLLMDADLVHTLLGAWEGVMGELFLVPPRFGYYDFPKLAGTSIQDVVDIAGLVVMLLAVFLLPFLAMSVVWYRLDRGLGRTAVPYLRYAWRLTRLVLLSVVPYLFWALLQPWVPDEWYWRVGSFVLFTACLMAVGPWIATLALSCTRTTDPALLSACDDLARRSGIEFQKVMVFHYPSEQVANAMVTGVLPFFRRLFVSDYLLKNCTTPEVEAVIGHELGHIAKHHLVKRIGVAAAAFAIATAIAGALRRLPHFEEAPHSTILIFWIVVFIPLLRMFTGRATRAAEFEADAYAGTLIGDNAVVAEALRKVYALNGTPRKLGRIARLMLSHPTIEERVARLGGREAGRLPGA